MRWINVDPGRMRSFLALMPFAILFWAYLAGSTARLNANPNDKLMPSLTALGEGFASMAFERDARTDRYLFWDDTTASLRRMGLGLGIATSAALLAGMAIGMLPFMRSSFEPLVAFSSMVPALAVLPILFIVFGVGEVSKVVLIIVGVLPFMIRDLTQRVRELPEEQWIKAQTLGASSWQLAVRVVLPQILPRLLDTLRLALGPAWLFLISAEAISATSGLGYRIFLVRRYLAMDIILPYVIWITLLAFGIDFALRRLRQHLFGWVDAEAQAA